MSKSVDSAYCQLIECSSASGGTGSLAFITCMPMVPHLEYKLMAVVQASEEYPKPSSSSCPPSTVSGVFLPHLRNSQLSRAVVVPHSPPERSKRKRHTIDVIATCSGLPAMREVRPITVCLERQNEIGQSQSSVGGRVDDTDGVEHTSLVLTDLPPPSYRQ